MTGNWIAALHDSAIMDEFLATLYPARHHGDAIAAMDAHNEADDCIIDDEGECAECVRLQDWYLATYPY